MNEIVSRIYELMAKGGISKTYLADKIGVSRNTIQNWKKLDSMPSLAIIERICGVFNITVEQFFSGIGGNGDNNSDREFIDAWRMLSDRERAAVVNVIETFKQIRRERK